MAAEHKLTVELERTGEVTDQIVTYRLNTNYLTPADEWEFVVYTKGNPAELRRKWAPLQRVKLYIDGELQLIGRIDETEGTGTSGAELAVRGRDFLGELVDGGADPSLRFTEKMDLGDALLSLFKPYGITGLVGNWNLTRNLLTGKRPVTGTIGVKDFKAAKVDDFKPTTGMGAYECGDKIVARHGFTIQSGGDRKTLAIVEPMFGQSPLYELTRPGNATSGSAKRTYANIPTVTIVTGRTKKIKFSQQQQDTNKARNDALRQSIRAATARWERVTGKKDNTGGGAALDKIPDSKIVPILLEYPSFGDGAPNEIGKFDEVKRIALEKGLIQSKRIDWKQAEPTDALYKPLYYEDKDSRSPEQLERGLRRELSRRMKDTLVYSCEVRGHRDPISGAVYAIDTIARVRDEIEDVNENMWILDRTFSNDGRGPRTMLQLIRPGSIAL